MDSRAYHHLLDRIGRLESPAETEQLREQVLICYGDTQRRRVILEILDDCRALLTRDVARAT